VQEPADVYDVEAFEIVGALRDLLAAAGTARPASLLGFLRVSGSCQK
jgi:hypothetical protein